MDGKFIAYYRVSTDHQGVNGNGMAAQRKAVEDYLNGGRWKLVGEFTEVESCRGAFALVPVVAEQRVRFVDIGVPKSKSHRLQLPPGNAGEGLGVVFGHKDSMTAPTARFGVVAAMGNNIPNRLGLRG